jgi:hypothetical protein
MFIVLLNFSPAFLDLTSIEKLVNWTIGESQLVAII